MPVSPAEGKGLYYTARKSDSMQVRERLIGVFRGKTVIPMSAQSSFTWGFDFPRNEAQRAATREAVTSSAALTGAYLAMNGAAALIASFGLLENSPAVIIGAMLIAMLYGPIIGIALGLAEASLPLLGRSLLSEIAGAAWVWVIGYAIGTASREIPIGREILSRTSPNILDLLIALVGGLAGGLTYLSTGLSGVIVGVAIATALVPPLASCGILLAHHLPGLAAGAFLLFLANFTAIAVGAMIIFWLAGHRQPAANLAHKVLVPRMISLALLGVLGVHLTITLRRTITQSTFESAVRRTLSNELAKIPGVRFVTVTLDQRKGATIGWVVVRTPKPLSPEQVGSLNDIVNRTTGSSVTLYVRSVITAETSREGYIYEPELLPTEEQPRISTPQ
jgi:uncharacterized hydrophobic protein (TIGR00271 family)